MRTPSHRLQAGNQLSLGYVCELVKDEVIRAETDFGTGFHSQHEAYGVLCEEVREYEQEVFGHERGTGALRAELIQIAAVAVRAAMLADS